MYVLNERQSAIIMDLVKSRNPVTAKALSFKYNVSIRTVRYDIEIVEKWLYEGKFNFVRKHGTGMWLNVTDKERENIRIKLHGTDPYVKFFSKDERKKIVIKELLKSLSPVNSEYLCEKTGVSKTTLLEDMREVREMLSRKGVFVEGKPGIGYVLEGDEKDIRKLISQILLSDFDRFELIDILNEISSSRQIDLNDIKKDLNLAHNINIEDIKDAISSSKKIYDFYIPDSSYISLIVHIAIAVDRLLSNQEIKLSAERINLLQSYKEYKLAKEISLNLEKTYNISIPEAEIANITFHLISANLKMNYFNNKNIYDSNNDLIDAVNNMINYLKHKLVLPAKSLESLKVDLLSHLKLTLKKIELNIPNENPLLEQIKENYRKYYTLSEEIAPIFKRSTGITLTDDEIGYITLHIAAHGEFNKENMTRNVLLVCTTGKGTAKVLKAKLKRDMPELVVKDTVSIFDLEDGNVPLENIDFIISTFPASDIKVPVIEVNPIITEKDISRIRSRIYGEDYRVMPYMFTEDDYLLDSLMSVVNKYVDCEDQYKLRDELGYVMEFIINHSSGDKVFNNFSLNKSSENIALIMADIGEMLEELKEYLKGEESYSKIWGLAIHLIMAIPRWNSKKGKNYDDFSKDVMTEKEGKIYKVVSHYINKIADKYNIFISKNEIISIVKYFE